MVNSPVWVNPIYGSGWTDGEVTVDTPDRFLAFLVRDGDGFQGVIQSGDLKNRKISMSKRHDGVFDGYVNVTIQSDELNDTLFGWGTISKDLME